MKLFFISLIVFIFNIPSGITNTTPLRFVVLSDIHIYTSGEIPEKAPAVISHIKELSPDLVLITGDHTNGNQDDTATLTKVNKWYESLDLLLNPLYENSIPVIPIVGNHDFYRIPHQEGYKSWASKRLNESFKILGIPSPKNPLYFLFNLKGNDFYIFNLWKQSLEVDQLKWINAQIKESSKVNNRFGFGHVPLKSTMGKTSRYFYTQASNLFNELNLDIYFCGHEHLHWDEENEQYPNLRQIIVGTASGTYNFPIKKDIADIHCGQNTCEMPFTKKLFSIARTAKGGAQQVHKQNWILVTVNENEIKTESFSLNEKGEVQSFYKN